MKKFYINVTFNDFLVDKMFITESFDDYMFVLGLLSFIDSDDVTIEGFGAYDD